MWLHLPSACSPSAPATVGLTEPSPTLFQDLERFVTSRGKLRSARYWQLAWKRGGLDPAPIWSDLLTFDAGRWRGTVDLVCAGFPCQPVSLAGARRAQADERWLWPHVARVIRDCGAPFVFLENVPGLVSAGLGDVLGDLASLGFDAEWGCYSAAEVGAPHLRERWFLLAYAGRECLDWLQPDRLTGSCGASEPGDDRGEVADTNSAGRWIVGQRGVRSKRHAQHGNDADGRGCAEAVGDAAHVAHAGGERGGEDERTAPHRRQVADHRFPTGPDRIHEWDGPQPAVRRGSHGTAGRVDRLRMLGNGVVWQQASFAFRDLLRRAGEG